MKNISLKLDEKIFNETESIVSQLKKSRNKYINEALEYYNQLQKRRAMKLLLARESNLVYKNSLNVLKEFEALEDED